MSAEKEKSKVHKLSLKGIYEVHTRQLIWPLLIDVGSSKLVAEFVSQSRHPHESGMANPNSLNTLSIQSCSF